MYNNALEMANCHIDDLIYSSSVLEGFSIPLDKIKAILRREQMPLLEEEIFFTTKLYDSWCFLLNTVNYPIDVLFLRQLNYYLGYGGQIRTSLVKMGGTTWVPEIPSTLGILTGIVELNKVQDVELRALKYFCFVARTQMFIDGNKRVAQLIANKILIENNIGIFQIPANRVDEFRKLLVKFYETNNDTKIISFMKKYCIRRLNEA